jgi:hypothetical protein
MVRSVVCVGVLLLVLAPTGRADEPQGEQPTPTTPEQFEASRKEYDEGARAYEHGQYDLALRHFEAALRAAPSPEFWFNIGRCHERLGRWAEAATAYERYLAGKPTVEDAVQIRERISDLRLRAHEAARLTHAPAPPPPSAPPSPRHPLRVPALILVGVTVALAAGATGAYFSAWSEYQSRRDACQGTCSPESLEGLRTRVQTAEVAGGVLFALAGAALVADVVLWIVDAQQPRRERSVAVMPRAGGLEVRF